MKMLKKINFAILAVVLGLGLVFTQSAFKAPVSKTNVYWRFDSNQLTDTKNYLKYTKITSFDENEICDVDDDLPCVLEVEPTIDNVTALNTHLMGFATNADVTASTIYRKGN